MIRMRASNGPSNPFSLARYRRREPRQQQQELQRKGYVPPLVARQSSGPGVARTAGRASGALLNRLVTDAHSVERASHEAQADDKETGPEVDRRRPGLHGNLDGEQAE